MKRNKISVATILAVVFVLMMCTHNRNIIKADTVPNFNPSPITANTPLASVMTYSAANSKFILQTPAKITSYYTHFKWTTSYKKIWIRIQKSGSSKKHDMKVAINSDSFNKYYIFKEGKGTYNIKIMGTMNPNASRYSVLCEYKINTEEKAPENLANIPLNSKILAYAKARLGKKIGRGECWDLAEAALDKYNSDWDGALGFGQVLNPNIDTIKTGDILQFRSVKLVSTKTTDKGTYTRTEWLGAPDHTAVVYEVIGKNHYKLIHQNIGNKRYLLITEIDLNNKVSGSVKYYRPIVGFFER